MKKVIFLFGLCTSLTILISCGNQNGTAPASTTTTDNEKPKSMVADAASYDPKRGEGKYSADNVKIAEKLDAAMATNGEKIAGTKCMSCHKTTAEKLVGPGWEGVTKRRTPYWIMNFITNPDPMIDKDPEVQAQLELCLVRMPNQNLEDNDARSIVEYMRKIDGVK
jgi:mono/diheme cytochrome c family protein